MQNVATRGQVRGDKARASRVQAEVLADDSLHNLIGIYNPLQDVERTETKESGLAVPRETIQGAMKSCCHLAQIAGRAQ